MKAKAYSVSLVIVTVLFTSIFLISCGEKSENEESAAPQLAEVSIPVEGMTCGSCEHHIESEVKQCEGVIEIKANHEQAVVYAKFDSSKLSLDEVVAAINETGYKAVKP